VEYILFPNEGHSLTHWKNVLVFIRKMEDFLAEHLGGRSAGFDYYELEINFSAKAMMMKKKSNCFPKRRANFTEHRKISAASN